MSARIRLSPLGRAAEPTRRADRVTRRTPERAHRGGPTGSPPRQPCPEPPCQRPPSPPRFDTDLSAGATLPTYRALSVQSQTASARTRASLDWLPSSTARFPSCRRGVELCNPRYRRPRAWRPSSLRSFIWRVHPGEIGVTSQQECVTGLASRKHWTGRRVRDRAPTTVRREPANARRFAE
jgi:hypothetical protein